MKKTLTTITLALVLTLGTTFANAGIIVSDKSATPCNGTVKTGLLVSDKSFIGTILDAIYGIIVSDGPAPCSDTKDGIIVSDRAGIIVSD